MEAPKPWWGPHEVPEDAGAHWCIGPLTLLAQRRAHDWRLAWQSAGDPLDARTSLQLPTAIEAIPEDFEVRRLGFDRTTPELRLLPVLADRSVVATPEAPFTLLPDERVTGYVSTPLWVQIRGAGGRPFAEMPIHRPSDTWFGPSTWEGTLCYASRTRLRLGQEARVVPAHRANTPIVLVNRSHEPLVVSALNLPVLHLSLFLGAGGHLWTEPLTLQRERDRPETAALGIGRGAPPDAGRAELVSEPRERLQGNMLLRAFSTVFG